MFELHNKKRYTGNRDSCNQFNSAGNVHSGSDMIGIEGYACQLSMSRRTIVKPMVEPQKDLKGATPESLAKALLHKRRAGERVAGDQVPVQQATTDQAGNRVPHLRQRV